ncbi:MAG TPA: MFS transporter [Vicinamibacterales bacterium]|nr:MFS transporter [Vicinamibacterales bacterium]
MSGEETRRRRWQTATAAALLVGYGGYYVCRSNLSVVAPQLLSEFGGAGIDKTAMGLISSVGVLAYAAGKGVNGVTADLVGGRRMFLGGMIGSIAATLAFGAAGGLGAFVALWGLNRFIQSMGWGALVKVASHWYEPERYGRVMAVLSLGFLFGDAAGRFWLGWLVAHGAGWRMIFVAAAATLGVIAAGCALVLHESPHAVGLSEPPVSPRNVFDADGAASRASSVGDVLTPYLRSPGFWLVCLVSLGLTLVREAFNAWIPTYLVEVYGLAQGDAAQKSSLFPLVGGVSVLCVGALSDRARTHRLACAIPLLAAGAVALVAIGSSAAMRSETIGLVLLGTVAFLVIGPYSLLAGAIAVELGGRRGSATAAGLIDTAGYLGAVASGVLIGSLAQHQGWPAAFRLLSIVTALSAVACAACWFERRSAEHRAVAGARRHVHAR